MRILDHCVYWIKTTRFICTNHYIISPSTKGLVVPESYQNSTLRNIYIPLFFFFLFFLSSASSSSSIHQPFYCLPSFSTKNSLMDL